MKRKTLFIALCLISINSFAGSSIMSITPSLTTDYIRSNGTGVITYTVTNNTSKPLTNITVSQIPNNASIRNNNCTTPLASRSSCTFQMLLQNQTTDIILSPRVCAYNNAVCSIPPAPERTQVNVISVSPSHQLTTYVGLQGDNQLQPINASTEVVGTPIGGFQVSSSAQAQDIAVSPDGTKVFVTTSEANSITEYNVTSGSIVATIDYTTYPEVSDTLSLGGLAISPDGKTLYVTDGQNNLVYVFDIQGSTPVYLTTISLQPPNSSINKLTSIHIGKLSVVVSPDDQYVYLAGIKPPAETPISIPATSYGAVINARNNTVLTYFVITANSTDIAISPDGTQLYISYSQTSTAKSKGTLSLTVPAAIDSVDIFNLSSPSSPILKSTIVLTDQSPQGLAISPDGNSLYVACYATDSLSKITDLFTSPTTTSMPIGSRPFGPAITPDGSKIYVSLFGENAVDVIDTANFGVSFRSISVPSTQTTEGNFIG